MIYRGMIVIDFNRHIISTLFREDVELPPLKTGGWQSKYLPFFIIQEPASQQWIVRQRVFDMPGSL